jgi:hypothetical protein
VRDGLRFFETIVWTAMTYNPVRVLGLIGLSGIGVAALVGLGLLLMRLQGVTELGPAGIFAVFVAVVCGAAGASIFALGASFNYFVSLFHRRPIRQGLFRKPLFSAPIETYFLPAGFVTVAVGLVIAGVSLRFSFNGWAIERLWLYLSGSALLMLIGVQLLVSWLQMSVLRELSQRDRMESVQ